MASLILISFMLYIDEIRLIPQNGALDIIALNETRLDLSIPKKKLVNVVDYDIIRWDRNISGGGVCVYIKKMPLRWLDTVFQGQFLPSLSTNYVAINKDCEKLPPQLY